MESDTHQRITYEATIDDAVDVALRQASRTRAFQKQFRLNVLIAGIGSGVAIFTAWMYIVGNSLPHVVFGIVAGALFGIVFAAIFHRVFEREIRKQHRKLVEERFAGKTVLHSELELGTDALCVRQAGMEMVFPWSACTGIRNNRRDVEISFARGMCVVPRRHFASETEKQAFFETARRLCAKATTPMASTPPGAAQ